MTPNTQKSIEEIVEELADIEHQRWSDWQSWCHKVLREHCPSPELEKVLERWDRQIATPYSELSEQEKESDRRQVLRYLHLITQYAEQQVQEAVGEANEIVTEELDSQSGIFGWHMPRCSGHAHDPRCPVVHLRRKIEERLSTLKSKQSVDCPHCGVHDYCSAHNPDNN